MAKHKKETVLLVGPHPDDVFISCAGFVISAIDKYEFIICCMTTMGEDDYWERLGEESAAWRRVSKDIDVIFFNSGTDTELESSKNSIISFIENICNERNPSMIFIPYYTDTHQDHTTISNACLSACRYRKNIIFYETPSTYNFQPTVFCELSDENIDAKKDISREYRSQVLGDKNYKITLAEIIESKALSNGVKTRACKYAEGYMPFKYFLR